VSAAAESEVLANWERTSFTAAGFTRDVYRRGSGPAVVVIHEVPGITPKVVTFADEVVECGFTAVMPDLIGTPGKQSSNGYILRSMFKVCVANEFATWATQRTSPIVAWLRALARATHLEVGGPGVGVVGMCFSGGFALGMMVDEIMLAPVLSQPSLPLAIGPGKAARGADLGLSLDDLQAVIDRASNGCQVMGLRYTGDALVGTRFQTLHDVLGPAFIEVPLASTTKRDHSVLTEHRDQRSVERVLDFLVDKLR
jgi:dienelactone hydrolase